VRIESKISLLVALALAFSPAAFAGRAEPAAQSAVVPQHRMHWLHTIHHKITGTVESLTASRLTLACQVKGKKQEMSFALDPETQREGTLATGEQATVRFRVENNRKIATFVTTHGSASTPAESEGAKR
jgi:hypothetical protein